MRFRGACRIALALVVAVAATGLDVAMAQKGPLYKDPSAPIPARVKDLLSRMTLEEKVAQMLSVWDGKASIFDARLQFDPAKASAVFPNGLGTMARPSDIKGSSSPSNARWRDGAGTVAIVNAAQRWAVEKTRLGVPIWFHEEGLHGYATRDATMFPQAIALGSSFDPDLVRRVNVVTAREMRARGVQEALSPVVDVARDPRWGRIEETFGEDPYLVGEMGVAAVRGLQGDALPLGPNKVYATLKHLTGHSQPESGTNVGPAPIAERTLREVFLAPFEQVIRRTNIRAVMPSYNEVDGVPSHANRWLLRDVLRGEWGFKGMLVSDYYGIDQLADLHHVEPDHASAAVRALNAGVDTDLPDGGSYKTLVQSVRDGKVPEALVDEAVGRVLEAKFEAGLFEHPYADPKAADAVTQDLAASALALEAARRSMVLLKNDGVLPLKRDGLRTLAVIGPNADVPRLGGYSGAPRHAVSVLQAINAKLAGKAKVVFSPGVRITESDDWWADEVRLADPAQNRRRIQEAVAAAQGADEVVLVLGDTEQTSREGWADNHLGDRSSLELPGEQDELAAAIFALGKPTVVVLLNGRPPAVTQIADKANGLIEGWYLGQEGGTAVADALFGDVNPGGKLSVTLPRSAGQLPMFYDKKPSARRGYLFGTTEPLFPFGYGLSYTRFELSAPRLSAASMKADGKVEVSVDVRNTGPAAGDEVVQLYIHDKVSSVTRPVKELKGFRRLTLAPGESRTVTLPITSEALAFWGVDMKRRVEPGEFEVMTGPNSVDLKTVVLTVTP